MGHGRWQRQANGRGQMKKIRKQRTISFTGRLQVNYNQ
jgi:hypothetical protein